MQRRAAAIYFVFFLVVAVGAWAYVGYAEQAHEPGFSLEGTTFENGTTATIGGVEYSVSDITGVATDDAEATLAYTDQDANQSATLEANATVTREDTDYTVVIANETNVSSFTLEESLNVTAILADDPTVENSVAEQNGTQYVVYRENQSLYPLEGYLPEPETREFSVGDDFAYENQTTTVAAVESSGVTLEWQGPSEVETDLTEGGNVTLAGGQQYFAHFTGPGAVTLAPQDQYGQYVETVDERDYFNERQAGLWGVTIVSAIAALFILATAYLPSRG